MSDGMVIIITLVVYKVVLVAIGVLASRKTSDTTDFFLGGRTLGPMVSAISASASSSSAWTLLGVSGYAFSQGISAIWLFPACVGGFLINWYIVAPRLHRISHETNSLTLTEVIAKDTPQNYHIAKWASAIVIFSLLFYVSSQFQGAGKTFEQTFELSYETSVLIGGAIIIFYTMLGGFWAVSITDTIQGLLMAVAAVILPVAALIKVGGFSELYSGLAALDLEALNMPGYLSLTQGMALPAGIGLVIGLLGIGLGYPGQPHVVNRFMALKDEEALVKARRIAILWAVVVYTGMIILGLCGRLIVTSLGDGETVFFAATKALFSPVIAGVMTASILSAIMSTADSQLLVVASSVTHDMNLNKSNTSNSLGKARGIVVVLSVLAILLALVGSKAIFDRVLFVWAAMGSAFGPILLIRLLYGGISPKITLVAMLTGFSISLVIFNLPMPRYQMLFFGGAVSFAVATVIAFLGRKK